MTSALARGELIKTWAMRGTLHLLTPEDAGNYLSLLAAGRSWEAPSWQKWFGVGPKEIEALRVAAREALDGRALTREELAAEVTKTRGLEHIGQELALELGDAAQAIGLPGRPGAGAQPGQPRDLRSPGSGQRAVGWCSGAR